MSQGKMRYRSEGTAPTLGLLNMEVEPRAVSSTHLSRSMAVTSASVVSALPCRPTSSIPAVSVSAVSPVSVSVGALLFLTDPRPG